MMLDHLPKKGGQSWMSNRKNPESVFSDDMWDRIGTNPDGSHYVYVNRVKVPLPDPKPTKSAAHQKIRYGGLIG